MASSGLEAYMEGVPGGKVPRGRMILPRVLIKFYRSRQGRRGVPERGNYLASAYADRRDSTVSAADIEGVTTFTKQRQYRLLRDISYPVADADTEDPPWGDELSTHPVGMAVAPAPIRTAGSGVQRGMLLEDTETGQVFSVDGVTREGHREIVVRCGAERTY